MNITNKKQYLMCVYEILKDYTDKDHLLTQEDIMDKLSAIYGCDCDRKTIKANTDMLKNFGCDIIEVKNKGMYLGARLFEKSEITFLVDAVFSSKVLPHKQAEDITNKLQLFLSNADRKSFKYLHKSAEISRTDNKELFWTIEVITEAIEKHKKISFVYNRKVFNNNPITHKNINPYRLANRQGNYYVICYKKNSKNVTNFRLEKMSSVKILDEDADDNPTFSEHSHDFDIAKYINTNFYMFGGKNVHAKLKIQDELTADYVFDWFGANGHIYKQNDEIFADVEANEMSLIYWCLQYGPSVELLEPTTTRQKLANIIKSMNEKYGN